MILKIRGRQSKKIVFCWSLTFHRNTILAIHCSNMVTEQVCKNCWKILQSNVGPLLARAQDAEGMELFTNSKSCNDNINASEKKASLPSSKQSNCNINPQFKKYSRPRAVFMFSFVKLVMYSGCRYIDRQGCVEVEGLTLSVKVL